jgi:hypothetical protein
MSIKYSSQESLLAGATPIPDIPDAPTINSASNVGTSRPYNNGSATLSISSNSTGGAPSSFSVVSSPGSLSGNGSSPITITGLQSGTSYTFDVIATNATGTSATATSSSITATTVPQAPTIGTVSKINDTSVSVPFTAGNNGGSSITGYTIVSNPSVSLAYSGTTSPITVTGTFSGTHTFTIAAVNANGTSQASSASNSIQVVQLSSVSGGTLSSDSTYYYRKFTATSNLTVANSPLTADIMVIGGGGGGGVGGGGGAGGFRVITGQTLSANTYTATIGGGGARRTGDRFSGDTNRTFSSAGTNSSLIGGSVSISATGGGRGADEGNPGATSGGSGGGSVTTPMATGNAGGYSPSEGNSGGTGQSSSNIAGGGGGGAGGIGGTGSGSSSGAGGSGSTSYSSWASVTSTGVSGGYAGGGGGGAYQGGSSGTAGSATHGGGTGGAHNTGGGTNGAENTGGGGGASGWNNLGWLTPNGSGGGGSGLVIVRYLRSAVGG